MRQDLPFLLVDPDALVRHEQLAQSGVCLGARVHGREGLVDGRAVGRQQEVRVFRPEAGEGRERRVDALGEAVIIPVEVEPVRRFAGPRDEVAAEDDPPAVHGRDIREGMIGGARRLDGLELEPLPLDAVARIQAARDSDAFSDRVPVRAAVVVEENADVAPERLDVLEEAGLLIRHIEPEARGLEVAKSLGLVPMVVRQDNFIDLPDAHLGKPLQDLSRAEADQKRSVV